MDVGCVLKDGVVAILLWGYLSRRGEFHHFTVMVGVSRFSRVRVSVSISFSDGAEI